MAPKYILTVNYATLNYETILKPIYLQSDLTNIDNEERTRVYARNKLEELITEVEAPNGFLEQLDDESRPILANGLAKMKRWDDGSTLEYEEKFRQLEALANRRVSDKQNV